MGIFLLPNPAYLSSITSDKLIELTNKERMDNGLPALTQNQLLTQAAINKGNDILKNQIFAHNINGKKFSSWTKELGYDYSYVGENLAIDFSNSEEIMEAWNNSPAHKENLLSPYYKEIGIAKINGIFQGQNTTLVVQEFGSQRNTVLPDSSPLPTAYKKQDASVLGEMEYFWTVPKNLFAFAAEQQTIIPLGQIKKASKDFYALNEKLNNYFIQPNFLKIFNNYLMIYFATLLFILSLALLLSIIYRARRNHALYITAPKIKMAKANL